MEQSLFKLSAGGDPEAFLCALEKKLKNGGARQEELNRCLTMWAGEDAGLPACKRLLEAGADLRWEDQYGESALLRAAWTGSMETLAWLAEKGADPAERSGRALAAASRFGGDAADCKVAFLISKGCMAAGAAALEGAVERGRRGAVRMLLDAGADPREAGYEAFKAASVSHPGNASQSALQVSAVDIEACLDMAFGALEDGGDKARALAALACSAAGRGNDRLLAWAARQACGRASEICAMAAEEMGPGPWTERAKRVFGARAEQRELQAGFGLERKSAPVKRI